MSRKWTNEEIVKLRDTLAAEMRASATNEDLEELASAYSFNLAQLFDVIRLLLPPVGSGRLTVPTVHRNGTSREALLDQVGHVGDALRVALNEMEVACPNMRDYYPQGDEAWRAAVRQHGNWVSRIRDVRKEIMELADAISDA